MYISNKLIRVLRGKEPQMKRSCRDMPAKRHGGGHRVENYQI